MRLDLFFQLKLNKKETIKYSGLDFFFSRLYKLRTQYIRNLLRDDCVRNVSEENFVLVCNSYVQKDGFNLQSNEYPVPGQRSTTKNTRPYELHT